MATISSANSTLFLSITAIFPSPVQMQGYGPDEIFGIDDIAAAETSMGVDGKLSAGFVFVEVPMNLTFQADSTDSLAFFDVWYAQQLLARDVFPAYGILTLPSIGLKYALTKGFLRSYSPMPSGGRTLRPRRHTIVWESMPAAPIS